MDQSIEEWVREQLQKRVDELMEIEMAFEIHTLMWGVPCGPTLSMLTFKPRGILVL